MKNSIHSRIISTILFLCAIVISGFSQSDGRYVEIRARAELELQPLKGATIKLFENNAMKSSVVTGTDGLFSFKLEMNKNYIIEISKENYVSKKLAFDTHLPDDIEGIWVREFSISVLKSCETVDYSALNEPVDIIKYNAKKNDFDSDKDYAYKMEARMDNVFMQIEKCIDDKYRKNIDLGDKQYNAKILDEAKKYYEAALEVVPGDAYATQRIEQINQQVGKQESIDNLYSKTIGEADALYAQKKYQDALLKYKGAQTLKPQEIYPRQKASEIESILAKSQAEQQLASATETQYNNLVVRGNSEMTNKNYAAAKQAFQQALTIRPGDQTIQAKIGQLDNLIAEQTKAQQNQKQIDESYAAAIAQGDKLFTAKDYAGAADAYNKALLLKPNEAYPKQKVTQINNAQAAEEVKKQREIEGGYQTAMIAAQKAVEAKDFAAAKSFYLQAQQFKPNDAALRSKITEVDNLVVQNNKQKQQDQLINNQYNTAIQKADQLFQTKNYSEAKSAYLNAKNIKPGETYPSQKIQEIDRLVAADQAKLQQEKQTGYQNAMSDGNTLMTQKQYMAAKASFQKALTYKPEDITAKNKILETDNLINQDIARQNALDTRKKEYDGIIAKADAFFAAKNYTSAKTEYQKASVSMPEQGYPKQKIQEIDQLASMAEAQKQRELEAGYQKAVTAAGTYYTRKSYDLAKKSYQDALAYKPDDNLSKSRIIEIDNIIRQEQAKVQAEQTKKKQYDGLISTADGYSAAKNYAQAKVEYQKAVQLMPAEVYPIQKITEIDNILAEQQRQAADLQMKENNYKTFISKADDLYQKKQYEPAKAEYNNALTIKPTETYPKNRISEIEILLNQVQMAKEKDQNYTLAITEGDRLFGETRYSEAKVAYNKALGFKPAEVYPKNQIIKIDNLVASAAKQKQDDLAKQKQYDTYIAEGDRLFNGGLYQQSKDNYIKALEMKPGEMYPKARIAKIDETLALLAQKKQTTTTPVKQESTSSKPVLAELNFKNDSERELYLLNLKKKYPAGITEEIYKEKNKITSRIIVIRSDEVREFRKVFFPSWGGSEYTLNGKPITQMFFDEQVKPKGGEYYNKTEY